MWLEHRVGTGEGAAQGRQSQTMEHSEPCSRVWRMKVSWKTKAVL